MTENDHATDQPLTEGADAHGNAGGNTIRRCDPTRVHVGRQPGWGKCEYMVGCPLDHRCRLNDLLEKLERAKRHLAEQLDRDCPNVDTIDFDTDRIQRYSERLAPQLQAHQELWARHDAARAHAQNVEKQHKGTWAFTLTYSLTQHQWSKEEAQTAMRTAITRLRHYYRNEIEEFEAVGEYTQSGAPHVHGHYRLTDGKRMTTKNFRRAYPIWNPKRKCGKGHEGGYHQPATRESDYAGYIQKDIDAAWLFETHHVATQEAHVHQEAEDGTASTDGSASPPDSPTQPDDR